MTHISRCISVYIAVMLTIAFGVCVVGKKYDLVLIHLCAVIGWWGVVYLEQQLSGRYAIVVTLKQKLKEKMGDELVDVHVEATDEEEKAKT